MTIEGTVPAPDAPDAPQHDLGLLETAVGVVTEPVPTLRRVTSEAPLGWAVLVTAILGTLSAVASVAQLRAAPVAPGTPELPLPEGPVVLIGAAIAGPIFGLIGLAIGAAFLHVVALILKGKGPYRGLFCGLAFASIPSLFQIPLQLAGVALGSLVQVIGGLLSFGVSVWIIGLAVVAVRENNDFTTGRALAVVLIPIGLLFLLLIGLVLLAIALAVGAAGGLFGQV